MTVTESSEDSSFSGYSSPVLRCLEIMNLINRLEIADGLKQLLLSKGFALKSLLNTSASDLAELRSQDCKQCNKKDDSNKR